VRYWRLKLSLERDILALKWLLRFGIVYLGLVHWVWNLGWFNTTVVDPYRELIPELLAWIFRALGQACRGQGTLFFLSDATLTFHINRYCTGIFPGSFIFLAVILTLPAPSLRSKIIWLVGGSVALALANLLRLVITIAIASANPDRFDPVHATLSNLLMLAGCGLSFWGTVALTLKPYDVRVFGRQLGVAVTKPA
jgi:exosortase/archaeosortase family protein